MHISIVFSTLSNGKASLNAIWPALEKMNRLFLKSYSNYNPFIILIHGCNHQVDSSWTPNATLLANEWGGFTPALNKRENQIGSGARSNCIKSTTLVVIITHKTVRTTYVFGHQRHKISFAFLNPHSLCEWTQQTKKDCQTFTHKRLTISNVNKKIL